MFACRVGKRPTDAGPLRFLIYCAARWHGRPEAAVQVVRYRSFTLESPGSTIPNVGASGAIAGVLGAYILMFLQARVNVLVGCSDQRCDVINPLTAWSRPTWPKAYIRRDTPEVRF